MNNISHEVLTNADVEAIHNGLVSLWRNSGQMLSDDTNRAAFILGFARAIEYAVLERAAPELVGGTH
jgi:hypothetical protein